MNMSNIELNKNIIIIYYKEMLMMRHRYVNRTKKIINFFSLFFCLQKNLTAFEERVRQEVIRATENKQNLVRK